MKRSRARRSDSPPLRLVPPRHARRAIADAVLDSDRPHRLGEVTLHPHQNDAVARLRQILQRERGALLADDVGLGKTYVALALARDYERVAIIAPAALLPMWRDAIRRTASAHVDLHSIHRISQRHSALGAIPASTRVLVVVDEAHHLRTPTTLRYDRVSEFVVGHDVLLVSATPLHNRRRDLAALFALFLGSRADALDAASLERLVVRRRHDDVPALEHAALPAIVHRPDVPIPFDRGTLDAILQLPDPVPARGGASAGALIRLGLLRAWCSSDAALAHAIRVRRLRGEAMAHALRCGRQPTNEELRTWIVGEASVQLGFPELLVEGLMEHQAAAAVLRALERHLDALAALQCHHAAHGNADAVRADALRHILTDDPQRKVVAFSQFTRTVHALHRALADIAGVASIAGRRARIASGHISRSDVLARFAPRAHGRPPPPSHEDVRLLLSTDLLAEGVNLQDAGMVVHLDLPWTDALRRQRIGRCARMGSAASQLFVVTLAPPPGVDAVLRIARRLEHKAGLARSTLGIDSLDPRTVPEAASGIRRLLGRWRTRLAAGTEPQGTSAPESDRSSIPWFSRPMNSALGGVAACLPGAAGGGWMALIRRNGAHRLIAHLKGRTSEDALHVLTMLELLADPAADLGGSAHACPATETERLVQAALETLGAYLRSHASATLAGEPMRAVSLAQRRATACLADLVRSISAPKRVPLQERLSRAEQLIEGATWHAAQRALEQWVRARRDRQATAWLDSWREYPALCQVERTRRLAIADGATAVCVLVVVQRRGE